ncbi:MAG: excinuclease ABC subunit UvrC [Rhodothalassiaceae bacterium]
MGEGKDRTARAQPRGLEVIRRALRTAPRAPGVYRMLDARGDALYVGKAKDIRKRVQSYTRPQGLSTRIMRMVAATAAMEFVTTHTEAEALLLEANLIKRLRPPFNIILRDDKSFPFILLRRDHPWPQITKHRGAQRIRGEYFGPFASASAVNRTLNTLQKIFLLRSCSDAVFANRSRPCLLYQIKRCAAPCVGRISAADYAALVEDARNFLAGRETGIERRLAEAMTAASEALDFETAALYRDRLRALARVHSQQAGAPRGLRDADVVAGVVRGGQAALQVFFYRAGQNRGNRVYFPRNEADSGVPEVMAAFLAQFYDSRKPPPLLLLSEAPAEQALLTEALSLSAGRKVTLAVPQRGVRRRLILDAERNAREALERRLAESAEERRLLEAVAHAFDLEAPPRRIEVYDNSHISGSDAQGAMIVATPEGFAKSQYRRFTIRRADLAPGDDFAMMREVMDRRFRRLLREDPDRSRGLWPDLMLIDGGQGQLSAVLEVAAEHGLSDLAIVAIAKGTDRNAGRETFHMPGRSPFRLRPGDPVLFYLERLRDEAHRFVIAGHRARRTRRLAQSPLDAIPGIGPRRKKALLHRFGSAREVAAAGIRELEAVEGVSKTLARTIYEHFHPGR